MNVVLTALALAAGLLVVAVFLVILRTRRLTRAYAVETERLAAEHRALVDTARKLAEAALRSGEERFRAAAEGSLDAFFLLEGVRDPAGHLLGFRVADLNTHAEQLLGRPRSAVQHQFVTEFPTIGSAALLDRYTRVLASREPIEEELRLDADDGNARWFRHQVVPTSGGVALALRDVTDHRLLEEQLRQAQKMDAMGRMAGGVAHDFNNLLTVIRGTCELLLTNTDIGPGSREDVQEVVRATDRAAALTQHLLAFSRKQASTPKPVGLNSALRDLEALLGRVATDRVRLALDLSAESTTVLADPVHVDQVLVNLAVNARDAMPLGGTLTISTATIDLAEPITYAHGTIAPGRYVRLTVTDTGHGMDQDVQQHVFEPFFTTKPAGKGTGLGLSTVYGIVRQSNGHITLTSSPGAGASFAIYLPRFVERRRNRAEPPRREPAPAPKSTILVVDDEPVVRMVIERILRRNGYAVLTAASGEEALDIVSRQGAEIQLMLTDMMMPGLDGRQVVRRVQQEHPALRVLFMSGYTQDDGVRKGDLAASGLFIQKPFTADELTHRIRRLLDAA